LAAKAVTASTGIAAVNARDAAQLDVHDDEVGHRRARRFQHLVPLGDRLYLEAIGPEHVAEQFSVEVIILDNHDPLCH
jgi:hypothetical protein